MKRELILYPNPILHKSTIDVDQYDAHLTQLIIDMFEVMARHNGVGLAAPQVNIRKSVIVYKHKDIEGYLINPVLLEVEDEMQQFQPEQCLSLPNIAIKVERNFNVRVGYNDTDGSEKTLEASGELAQILQHEIDHLEGKILLDHLSMVKRDIVKRKLAKQRRFNQRQMARLKQLDKQTRKLDGTH